MKLLRCGVCGKLLYAQENLPAGWTHAFIEMKGQSKRTEVCPDCSERLKKHGRKVKG